MPLDLEIVAHSGDRPLPTPNEFSGPFWEAARRHELVLQRCRQCGTVRYYPRPGCPQCQSREATWEKMSGEATIYSFTVVTRPLARWFADRVPIIVAIVALKEGVRMMTNIVGCDPDSVYIGMPVGVCWDDVDGAITLPNFFPSSSADRADGGPDSGDEGGVL
jgi:uncharacterized protein